MGNTENGTVAKKSWIEGLKEEFRKIIWPDKEEITKQTVAVIATSVVVGILIAVIDTILKYGIDFIVGL